MAAVAYVNGKICRQQDALISVFDHGFLYGEGVYEVARTYHRVPFLMDRHLRRLRNSARMIGLPVPMSDAEIQRAVQETIDAYDRQPDAERTDHELYIRVLVTRGLGELNYDPDVCVPSVVIIVKPNPQPDPAVHERGVSLAIVSMIRNHPGSVSPLMKSNNLLNNAMAMQEAMRKGAYEGLMRNYRGELAECASSNIFVVKDGALRTPPLQAGILPGITREFLLEIAPLLGVPAAEATLRDDDLFGADEAFLSITTRELVPVVAVDGRTIGTGRPGPITRMLSEHFHRRAMEAIGMPGHH
ncbi:MAG: aminotransferase class IV [Acidobacteria bacterium]|nr:aminotransferase class IV [Acidobacteriota bacterium]